MANANLLAADLLAEYSSHTHSFSKLKKHTLVNQSMLNKSTENSSWFFALSLSISLALLRPETLIKSEVKEIINKTIN